MTDNTQNASEKPTSTGEEKSNTPVIIVLVALILGGLIVLGYVSQQIGSDKEAGIGDIIAENVEEEAEENADADTKAAAGPVELKPGNPVVAQVNGEDIYREDVFKFIQQLPEGVRQLPPEKLYPIAIDQVINARILDDKAAESEIAQKDDVQAQIEQTRTNIIRNAFVQQVIEDELDEKLLKAKYDEFIKAQGDVKEVRARHILVKEEAKAKEIITQLEGGANFETLAKANSIDTLANERGGDLGYFTKEQMVPEFADAAYAMGKGETSSAPIQTQFGWHVIEVLDTRTKPNPGFNELKPMLEASVRGEIVEQKINEWREAANIQQYDMNGEALNQNTSSLDEVLDEAATQDTAEMDAAEPEAGVAEMNETQPAAGTETTADEPAAQAPAETPAETEAHHVISTSDEAESMDSAEPAAGAQTQDTQNTQDTEAEAQSDELSAEDLIGASEGAN